MLTKAEMDLFLKDFQQVLEDIKDNSGTEPKQKLQNLLHKAVENGMVDFLKNQIENGIAHVNERKSNGLALIHTAVSKNQLEVVKMLTEKGANLNLQAKGFGLQESPLHLATYKGNNDIVNLLLQNGADPDVSVNGVTPLHFGIYNNDLTTIDLLIKKTVNDDSKDDSRGFTPLHCAVSVQENLRMPTIFEKSLHMVHEAPKENDKYKRKTQDHRTEIVNMLLESGANFEESSNLNQTALLLATENGFLDAAKILIEKGAKVNVQDNKKFTPLHYAINLKNEEFIKYLIGKKASINVSSVDNTYPIHMASKSGLTKIVKLLIEEGADVNVVNIENNKHYTPLCWAVMEGHLDVFEILLQSSARVNLPDLEQNKPIHHAAAIGHFEMAKLLLNHGVNINAMNEKHQRPISLAVANGFLEITKLLIQNGADLNFNDKTGMDPLCIAISKGIKIYRIDTLIRRCFLLGKEFYELQSSDYFNSKTYLILSWMH